MENQKQLKKSECILCDGVAVAEYSITLPVLSLGTRADKKTNRLLEKIYGNTLKYVEKLSSKAKKEYTDEEGPKKRFYFRPYRYTLICTVGDVDEKHFSLTLESTLSRRAHVLSHDRRTVTARRRDGVFVPPRLLDGKKRKCKQKLTSKEG